MDFMFRELGQRSCCFWQIVFSYRSNKKDGLQIYVLQLFQLHFICLLSINNFPFAGFEPMLHPNNVYNILLEKHPFDVSSFMKNEIQTNVCYILYNFSWFYCTSFVILYQNISCAFQPYLLIYSFIYICTHRPLY